MNDFEVILCKIKMEWLSCQSTILSQAGKRRHNLICYVKHYIVLKYIISSTAEIFFTTFLQRCILNIRPIFNLHAIDIHGKLRLTKDHWIEVD